MEIQSAAVIGLGLMGGSVARELAGAGVSVLGYDRDPDAIRAARGEGVVSGVLDATLSGIENADLVLIALPVRAAVETMGVIARRRPRGAVTDLASTKQTLVAAAGVCGLGPRFVGSHPMAGDHRSGWGASRTGMFRGRTVYLTRAAADGDAVERVERMWRGLGASVVELDPEAHDRQLALTSHLPQVVSSALALALAEEGIGARLLGPGGRDVARLAGSSPEMWADIAFDNRDELSVAVAALQVALGRVRVLLASGNEAGLREWFEGGRAWSALAENAPESVAAGPVTG